MVSKTGKKGSTSREREARGITAEDKGCKFQELVEVVRVFLVEFLSDLPSRVGLDLEVLLKKRPD